MSTKPSEMLTVIEPDSKEFRKANNAVSVRVKSGPTLSLLGRRLFNVLLYQAQTLGTPGVNAPPPWGACPNPQDYYWMPLPDVVQDSAWGSKDHKLVVSTLQQLQTTLVESDDPSGRFTSVQLIGSVHLVKGSGRRPSMVGWEFPRSTRDILSNPDFYTKLSIYHLTSLQTSGGAALYEISKRYLTNVGGKTNKNHWHWWHDTLTGKQMGSVEYPEYKYFKRDVLIPAMEEVNRTDINVALTEVKSGRAVTDLQFTVTLAQQTSLELPPGPVIDSVLLERVCALGFTERQACEVLGSTEDGFLRSTLELVEERMADTSMEPLKSPVAFMRKALKDDYVATAKKKGRAVAVKPVPSARAVESPAVAERRARVNAAIERYDAMSEMEKKEGLYVFQLASSTHKRLKEGGVVFKKTMGNWLVDNEDRAESTLLNQSQKLFPTSQTERLVPT